MSLGQAEVQAAGRPAAAAWVNILAEVVKVVVIVVGAGAGPFLLAVTVPLPAWLAPLLAGALALGLGLLLARPPRPQPVKVVGAASGGAWRLVARAAPDPGWAKGQQPEVQLLLDYLRLARVYAAPLTPTSATWLYNVARHAPWELDAPGLEQAIDAAGKNGVVLAAWLADSAAQAEAAAAAEAAKAAAARPKRARPADAPEPYLKPRRLARFLAGLNDELTRQDAPRLPAGHVVSLMADRLYGSGSVPGGTPAVVDDFVEYLEQKAPHDLDPLDLPRWVDGNAELKSPPPAPGAEPAAAADAGASTDAGDDDGDAAAISAPDTLLPLIGLLVLLPGLVALLTQDRGAEQAARAAWYFAAPAILAWAAAGVAALPASKGRLQIAAAGLILLYLALSYATPVRLVDGPPTRLDWADSLLGVGCGLALASLLVSWRKPSPGLTSAPPASARRNTDV